MTNSPYLTLNGLPKRPIASLSPSDLGCIIEIAGLQAGILISYHKKLYETSIVLEGVTQELSFKNEVNIDVYFPINHMSLGRAIKAKESLARARDTRLPKPTFTIDEEDGE